MAFGFRKSSAKPSPTATGSKASANPVGTAREPGKVPPIDVHPSDSMRPALTIPSAALTAFINPDRVRARAFEIFLERGDGPGDATSDWCRAERELRLSAARGSA